MNSVLDRKRAAIDSIIDDIAAIPEPVRRLFRQDEDHEAYEIVRRLERTMARRRVIEPGQAQ